MSAREHAMFLGSWDHEAKSTVKLLGSLPVDKYDFRPDAGARSIGEMAWHLAEIDAYIGGGVANGAIDFSAKLPGLERPRTIGELAPGYERVHSTYVAKVAQMKPEDMDAMMPFMGREMRRGDVLWNVLLHHSIHHRGMLSMMCRLAGGVAPGMYGPNREEMAAMQAQAR
jgi:uncharacterized damage-inducible protein DinB